MPVGHVYIFLKNAYSGLLPILKLCCLGYLIWWSFNIRVRGQHKYLVYSICTCHILFILPPLINTWIVSTFQLLSLILLWTRVHKIFHDLAFSYFGYLPKNWITGSYGHSVFNFLRSFQFLWGLDYFTFLPTVCKSSNFSTSSSTRAVFCIYIFL